MCIRTVLAVAFLGSLGVLSRFGLNLWFSSCLSNTFLTLFPLATCLSNLIGCFLMGSFLPLFQSLKTAQWIQTSVLIGFLGGFTTLSSLMADTHKLWAESKGICFLYTSLTLIGGFSLFLLGSTLSRRYL